MHIAQQPVRSKVKAAQELNGTGCKAGLVGRAGSQPEHYISLKIHLEMSPSLLKEHIYTHPAALHAEQTTL